MTLREAAETVLRAVDAYRDARNGQGHPGERHDRVLHLDGSPFYDQSGDCVACAATQMGAEDDLAMAYGDLRELVGQERKPWETRTQEQWDRAIAVVRGQA